MSMKYYFKNVVLLAFWAACTQSALAIDIPSDTSVGTWDDINRVYTLTSSVTEGLVVTEENLTLNAASGVTVAGSGSGVGILIDGVKNITVQNMTVQGFSEGIRLLNYHNSDALEWEGVHIIENNTTSSCSVGINLISNSCTIATNDINVSQDGITIGGSDNNTVSGNTIVANNQGISIGEGYQGGGPRASKSNTATGNTITGGSTSYGIGISLGLADEITLSSNTVTNYESGIKITSSIDPSIGSQITTNNISNNFYGIHVYASKNHVLTDNNIMSNNASGISGGIWIQNSNENTLTGNILEGDADSVYGIYLRESNDNTLTGNTCSNNDDGIRFINSHDNTLTNNTVSDNRVYGISIDPSTGNQINNNNFIDNTTQAVVADSESINNNFNGNYWSNWTGPDDDDNGLVDLPYIIRTADPLVQDGIPYTVPDGWIGDTIPPEITCPGDITIEAMGPDGVPIDDDRIQTFLEGASATDNVDPPEDIVITNDAPALFPPGDTIVTFTATDTSDNSSSCQSTVTVVEAAESCLRIIPRIINREGRLSNILAVIRFPEGTAEEDIDIGQLLVLYPGDSAEGVEATNQRVITWYSWGTLRVSVFACFNKDDVMALIPEDGSVEMMVIGRFTSGQYFYGFDDVNIISWSWDWW